jgi:RNA polymerase sigma-70 factor (ECF subfamily)
MRTSTTSVQIPGHAPITHIGEAKDAFDDQEGMPPLAVRQRRPMLAARPRDALPERLKNPMLSNPQQAETVAQLFRENNRALIGFLVARLRSLQDAKEVAQEAYVRLLQLGRPDSQILVRAYLFRVAGNLAIDRLRRRATRDRAAEDLSEELPGGLGAPERQLLADEQLLLLSRCLQELPEKVCSAFLMCRLEGLSQNQIAERLGVTDRMVRKYITQALLHCRLRLDGATEREAGKRSCKGST